MALVTDPDEVRRMLIDLRQQAATVTTDDEGRAIVSRIAEITRAYRIQYGIGIPTSPLQQAQEIDPKYVSRPHLEYLSSRITNAVRDVERGRNRQLAISMPPRAGKSHLISRFTPLWFLRRHPEWKIVMASHDGGLTSGWARWIRQMIEDKPDLGIALKRDGGAGTQWETLEGGGMFATSMRGSLIGRGARVMIIDDPVKDFVEAHSIGIRQNMWDWWLSVAQTRLEPPYLVIVVMTRWHEDDFVGRLLSHEYEGDPREWEHISLPALADTETDVLGRSEGEPLISPLLEETVEQAVARWSSVRTAVGTYTFSAMYQQRPAPAKGAIFDSSWWRFWTSNPELATEDGRVVYMDPRDLTGGRWLDSWDCNFKSGGDAKDGGWVVGQRWVRLNANRYLIAQQRGRWSFTQTLDKMQMWAETSDTVRSPCGHLVHERYIEERANGAAIIDVMKEHVSGIKPVNPTISKEARARAVTPEVESGNVFIPHPSDPGNEWVADFLSELRNFPHDMADDQVDALTQALSGLRDVGKGNISVPGRVQSARTGRPGFQISRDISRGLAQGMGRPRY